VHHSPTLNHTLESITISSGASGVRFGVEAVLYELRSYQVLFVSVGGGS